MDKFAEVYANLNTAQRQAVDTIYGPVLVIAGPGTGKTQLLSARVAHILQVTDTLPQNILCLTFTENGALNMRERLTKFIGPHAYDVQIGTYHAFGRTVIGRFPEYFTELRLERPVDELGKRQILSHIIDEVDYRSPIKQVRHHLGDLVSTISEVKRGLFTPEDLRRVALDNLGVIEKTADTIGGVLAPYAARMPSKLDVAEPLFRQIHDVLLATASRSADNAGKYDSLAVTAADALSIALDEAASEGKTSKLTGWKNKWLVKNKQNEFVLAGALESARIAALADVLEAYQAALQAQGLYDFDDMILRAIEVLENNDELRFTLQEQYQFILLDEFQDTNAAQLKLVELLTNNPVHEGRPNVLAVGDDDQAIYAFQGAQYSNMLDFYTMYRDTAVIALSENYRSNEPILQTAAAVSAQIESRLHSHMSGINKVLIPKAKEVEQPALERKEYLSDIAELDGVANEVKSLIAKGIIPSEIAILAPKHRYLEPLVAYLQKQGVPVAYEKRENILESLSVRQLLTMSKLVTALHAGHHGTANSLWPEILSYDFWGFSVADIWRSSWQANDTKKSWSEVLLEQAQFKHAALLFLTLSSQVETQSCETILDALIGTSELQTRDKSMPSVRSPFRDYYFREQGEAVLYETVANLNVLKAKLRERQTGKGEMMRLPDLLSFVAEYEAADTQMLNTSPYSQAADAVQLMTVYKAKGLEWQHVFLLHCNNEVWGSKSTGMGNKLTLPANLTHIRHAGATEDERLRLLFVALTRAKSGLHLSSYQTNFAGKSPERLKYFDEIEEDDKIYARTLPEGYQNISAYNEEAPSFDTLAFNWQSRHLLSRDTSLQELLRERLETYQLSPTHLTHFIDLKYGGPESFQLGVLLKFPGSPSPDSSFGNTVHDALEWMQNELNRTGQLPDTASVIDRAKNYLSHEPLAPEQITQQQRRLEAALTIYLESRSESFSQNNVAEKSFRREGVLLDGEVLMGGKIDLLEIDKTNKTIVVVDYKTGESHDSWKPETDKLHKYMLQLYCYKLLVENSTSYRGYTVTSGRLEFVEPDTDGAVHALLLEFSSEQLAFTKQLLHALWKRVKSLNMPDISGYSDSLAAMKQFEKDLVSEES